MTFVKAMPLLLAAITPFVMPAGVASAAETPIILAQFSPHDKDDNKKPQGQQQQQHGSGQQQQQKPQGSRRLSRTPKAASSHRHILGRYPTGHTYPGALPSTTVAHSGQHPARAPTQGGTQPGTHTPGTSQQQPGTQGSTQPGTHTQGGVQPEPILGHLAAAARHSGKYPAGHPYSGRRPAREPIRWAPRSSNSVLRAVPSRELTLWAPPSQAPILRAARSCSRRASRTLSRATTFPPMKSGRRPSANLTPPAALT